MSKYTDVSIDLETLGTAPGSVITQIGLCAFNADALISAASATLIRIDPQDALDNGFTISWATIAWWLSQSDAAREAMVARGANTHPVGIALHRATDWLASECEPDVRPWGHGASFDVTLLEMAYKMMRIPIPWDYHNVRDLRTLLTVAPEGVEKPVTRGTEHQAMDDAINQAEWIKRLVHAIKQGRP